MKVDVLILADKMNEEGLQKLHPGTKASAFASPSDLNLSHGATNSTLF